MSEEPRHKPSNPNREKPYIGIDQNGRENSSAEAAMAHRQDISTLDFDCFEEAFDYLPLGDLISIGQTCKHLQQIAGLILQRKYSAAVVQCKHTGISIGYYFHGKHFLKFIRKISIIGDRSLNYFLSIIQSNVHQLKEINLFAVDLNVNQSECMKQVLKNVESLRIKLRTIETNFHEAVLAFCPNLRRLCVASDRNDSILIGSNNDWLFRKYGKLEHFELEPHRDGSIDGLNAFLEINSNIRKFATTAECLWENRQSMISANVQLDELAIWYGRDEKLELIPLCNLLNVLHEGGFYKRLHFYFLPIQFDQTAANRLASLNALVKLYVEFPSELINLTALKDLEEIFSRTSARISDLATVATNLKRIHFLNSSFDEISLLISGTARLEQIKVDFLENGTDFSTKDNIIDLAALNTARLKLNRAEKVTLYVREEIYLATKWASNVTELDLVRLKREQSHEWHHDFNCFK